MVQTRAISDTHTGKAEACKYNLIDSAIALNGAFFVNAAILVMAAAVFYSNGLVVTEIQEAYHLLQPILGTNIAPVAFGIALVAAGQSSTLTGTLSGQIVMEGFINIKLRPWLRRFITRSLALLPAVIVIAISGNEGTFKLLIFSQVILSLQLPFAIVPLVHFTSDKMKMGNFANKLWIKILAWIIAAVIMGLNMMLVYSTVVDWIKEGYWIAYFTIPFFAGISGILLYIIIHPFVKQSKEWTEKTIALSKDVAAKIRPTSYKNIGVAIEHGEGDSIIISEALTIAKLHKAKISLLHIVDTPGTMVHGNEEESLHSREDHAYILDLAREIEEHDVAVETSIRYGNPSTEIIKAVEEEGYDFIVFGSHGHHRLGDVIFGQTVDNVRHSIKIPVLVVRTSHGDRERALRLK